jgi:predicted RecB family nuclease
MPLKKQLAGLKRFAEIVDTSSKDASRARKVSRSPKMQQEISDDRRKGLSKNFKTVRQAIADRDAVAKRKAKKKAR